MAADGSRRWPAIGKLVQDTAWGSVPHPRRVAACRAVLARLRASGVVWDFRAVLALCIDEAGRASRSPLVRVVNGTGVVLHTNLGRAPLPRPAIDALALAAGYVNLELDLETGERDDRQLRLGAYWAGLVGCEDVLVVNNNAAAVWLLLSAVAKGQRVAISRGELVEIGGSFRMPDIMEASGAMMVEVGTTNRTRLDDYRRSGADWWLKVHRSNFVQLGFVEDVDVATLAGAGRVLWDLGSGDAAEVIRALDAGVDAVCWSGDKLPGGPQAGIIAGKRAVIEACRRHPLMRVLRPDKLVLIALDAVLRTRASGQGSAVDEMLGRADEALRASAEALALRCAGPWEIAVVRVDGVAGGGADPEVLRPSWAMRLSPRVGSEGALAAALRAAPTPVIARVRDGAVFIDVRTLLPGDEDAVAAAVAAAADVRT